MSGKRNWGDNMTNRMDGKTPPQPLDGYRPFKVASKLWKKKYKCKKNKGDHTWVLSAIKWSGWRQHEDGTWEKPQSYFWRDDKELPYWVNWECSGCKKHGYEWGKLDKKFEPFRHTTWKTTQGQ